MQSDGSLRDDESGIPTGDPAGDQRPAAHSPPAVQSNSVPRPHAQLPAGEPAAEEPRRADAAGESSSSVSPPMAEANTVIRGSDRPRPRSAALPRSPAVVAQVLLGQRLNQYLLEDLIGGGGMGAVFRAHDTQLDRVVAIKVIPFVGDDPDLHRRFRNEAKSAARLDDPRIARVFDAGSHDDWHYIVFEYIEGINIRDLVTSQGVLTIDDAVYFTAQLAGAIQHAADRGIVHRDIKPSNVIVGAEGTIKLVDMGLARSEQLELSDDMTASGVTLGTFDYISPEQAQDPRSADLRSDIYSLGCTLYFMLTGKPPFAGGTMTQKVINHGTAPPPNVQKLRPAVSSHLTAVLNKMLAKAPEDRYSNANLLLADLREVAVRDQLVKTAQFAPVPVLPPPPLPNWVQTYWPFLAALAIILVAAGWLRLESAALRDDPEIPATATAPQSVRRATLDADQPAIPDPRRPDDLSSAPQRSQSPPVAAGMNAAELDADPPPDAATTQAATAASARQATVVRIVDQMPTGSTRDADGTPVATNLAKAIELATEHGAGRIEIAVPSIESAPLIIDSETPLLIGSTVGGTVIRFRDAAPGQDQPPTQLVVVESDQLDFEELHFVWSADQLARSPLAMFDLSGQQQLRMNRCSVTIESEAEQDDRMVHAFRVSSQAAWPFPAGEVRSEAAWTKTHVELQNCIVRGEMSMFQLGEGAKLSLVWDNGLLAVSHRMIDAGGTRLDDLDQPEASVELVLSRLTAHAPQGIARSQLSDSLAYPIPIDRQAMRCLFIVEATQPHYLYDGLASLSDRPQPLRINGTSNWYVTDRDGRDPMLLLKTNDGRSEATLMRDIQRDPPDWIRDSAARWSIPTWASARLAGVRPSEQTPEDYRLQAPAAVGFDLESLPALPHRPALAGVANPADAGTGRLGGSGLSGPAGQPETGENTSILQTDLTFPRPSDLIGGPSE